jgi:hypothetical protein
MGGRLIKKEFAAGFVWNKTVRTATWSIDETSLAKVH